MKEQEHFPFTSIVIVPYTSRIMGVAGEVTIPERQANVALSSFSAMATEAAQYAYNQKWAPKIIALGENTFKEEGVTISTADLMKKKLTQDPRRNYKEPEKYPVPIQKKPVPESDVITIGNLQDTDKQLEALKSLDPKLVSGSLFVVMDFHKERVQGLFSLDLPGAAVPAEDIIRAHYKKQGGKDMTKLGKQLKHFTPQKVKLAETIFRTASKIKPVGDILLGALRKVRGGQTITDYHNLTSAKHHLEVAKKAIKEGKLLPGDITA